MCTVATSVANGGKDAMMCLFNQRPALHLIPYTLKFACAFKASAPVPAKPHLIIYTAFKGIANAVVFEKRCVAGLFAINAAIQYERCLGCNTICGFGQG